MDINKELLALILFSEKPFVEMRDLMYRIGIKKLTEYQKKRPKQVEEQATSSNQPPRIMDVSQR